MKKYKVYLAGPISGLEFNEAINWRTAIKEALEPEIEAFSPLRSHQHLASVGKINQAYNNNALTTDRGINTRDHFDCHTADLIFCNLLGSLKLSIGTIMEIAWAFAYRKPLVVAIEDKLNLHDHPMIREAISYRVNNLDLAVKITKSILLS